MTQNISGISIPLPPNGLSRKLKSESGKIGSGSSFFPSSKIQQRRVSEEKLFVRDGRAMSKAPFWHKNFCLEMFEDRQTRPFETRIWSLVAPIEEDPVGSRVHVFEDIRIT